MSQIRVAVVDLPRMLRDIVVSMLATEKDIEVVAPSDATSTLAAGADVVILNLDDAEHFDLLQALLTANPRLRIVAVAADGRRITLYELRQHRTPLGELSAAGLVAVVRDAGQTVALERKWIGSSSSDH